MVALLFAGAFSLAFTLFLTPLFIKLFHRLQWGQFIRDDGPQTHHTSAAPPRWAASSSSWRACSATSWGTCSRGTGSDSTR
ncbi:phospho-N-acetylmuramoyl-pentapeptide-transferase [Clavibacter michiganensis subsp. michiganensis]|uniref:Phospho-N-acetylmuramoyl-pentapeptide-transferase n=1 Tax=Clavibacter michiganensis subsp. michiganensis TaxID=33013 RepID=A0A251XHG1_CLAMM|nr:phospho-N-acetylmuramoyl-pentapeptide-transferase [Clavibacter michiganensis subsp. michiganensis]OUE02607.1 phospho-N-acetylmuramoyl-pentapeptide-transferase [Clavibacter michiganensis subsp. michiganensis]